MCSYVQLGGDLEDVEQALGKPQHLWRRKEGYGSCSALVKPIGSNNDDLYTERTE